MAKKTVSFSLESDIIEYINNFKEKNNLSSNSSALERIILEKMFTDNKIQFNNINDVKNEIGIDECSSNNITENKENEFKIDTRLKQNISSAFDELK